jgi:putative ABC transport system permease protein
MTNQWRWLEHLGLDVRYALRGLRRWPGFTLLSVLLLAVGTGATTALVSVVTGVLMTPPPYEDPARLVLLTPARADGQPYRGPCTARQCTEWGAASSFERTAAYFWIFDYLVLGDGSRSLEGLAVSPEYFEVIGRRPVLGRAFTTAETSAQTHPVVLISDALWRRQFKADPRIVGTAVTLSRHRTLTIVGVMPPGIRFLPAPLSEASPGYDVNAGVDFWVPQAIRGFPPDAPIWNAVARLRPGVSLETARAEVVAIAARQAGTTPTLRGMTASVEPLPAVLNQGPAQLLVPLLGAALCVLVIACANAGALQLARALRRDRELAVHAALGASPARLVRRALAEHAVVGVLGGVLGSLLAYATLRMLVAAHAASIPRLDAVAIDGRLLAWSVGLGLLTGLAAGLPSAVRIRGGNRRSALERGGPSARVAGGSWRTLQILTGAQIALTLALLLPAGLLVRSLHNAAGVAPGYETEQMLTMMVTDVRHDWQAFHRRALERVEQVPGVSGAAFGWGLPLTNTGASTGVRVTASAGTPVTVPVRAVTASFFDVLGMRIVTGRPFRDTDDADARPVAIVTASLADRLFPGVDPVGRMIDVPGWEGTQREIIGVLADVRAQSLTQPTGPEVYLPLLQATAFTKHLVVRTRVDPMTLAPAVQGALRAVDPTVAIESVKTFAQIRTETMTSHRLARNVMTAFGALACLLAAAGVNGSLAWAVAQRRREFAIRAALGADRRRVLAVVVRDVTAPLLGGATLGVGLAMALSHALRSWLFGVESHDPATLAAAGVVLLLLTLAASWLPARAALGVEPSTILRAD